MTSDADWIDFQPHKQDLGKVLGELEAAIMKSIWTIQDGDVKTIHREIFKERKAAVTTVATVLDRLHRKGLVRSQFDSTVVSNVFKGLFESFGESAISYLAQTTGIEDHEELEELKKRLEQLLEE